LHELGILVALLAGAGLVACGGTTTRHGNDEPVTEAPIGPPRVDDLRFSKVVAGREHYCGLTLAESDLVCVKAGAVELRRAGPFRDFSLHEDVPPFQELCTIDAAGALACDGSPNLVPAGDFAQVSIGFFNACALATDGTVACWFPSELGGSPAPEISGAVELSVEMYGGCVRDGAGHVTCFGEMPGGEIPHFIRLAAAFRGICGIVLDPTQRGGIVCVGENGLSYPRMGTFTSLDVDINGRGCASNAAGAVECWDSLPEPTSASRLGSVSVSATQVCALDEEGGAHCLTQP
jgi:hypothetical protein